MPSCGGLCCRRLSCSSRSRILSFLPWRGLQPADETACLAVSIGNCISPFGNVVMGECVLSGGVTVYSVAPGIMRWTVWSNKPNACFLFRVLATLLLAYTSHGYMLHVRVCVSVPAASAHVLPVAAHASIVSSVAVVPVPPFDAGPSDDGVAGA
ncbi:unnamed protein product [Protopolystoma xenopodis]|uniref:Uncharacterized protein n=1 Tax=Protopolystoma xenopodis TaxID=117903 RepID=A0A3S5C8S9_9PLAT|nr:unnamed protein product [Protopolystoma xenopodis]